MKNTSYTQKFLNITNFPYNKPLVVIFTIFRYARDLYRFIEGTGAGRETDHNTLPLIERHLGLKGYRERKQGRSCVNFIKINICTKIFSYE